MTRWQRFIARLIGDLCYRCRDGRMIEYGQSGMSFIRLHFRCEKCGAESTITHHPGD